MTDLEKKIDKYKISDWIPLVGSLKLLCDDERYRSLINRNGKFGDFLYAAVNSSYGTTSGAFSIIYLITRG